MIHITKNRLLYFTIKGHWTLNWRECIFDASKTVKHNFDMRFKKKFAFISNQK